MNKVGHGRQMDDGQMPEKGYPISSPCEPHCELCRVNY